MSIGIFMEIENCVSHVKVVMAIREISPPGSFGGNLTIAITLFCVCPFMFQILINYW